MPTTTTAQEFPVPVSGDDPDVAADLLALANAIEKRVAGVYNSSADRGTKVPSPQEGQVAFLKDTNLWTYYDGAAWVEMFPAQVSITSGTSVPANGSGNNGDVFLKV